MILVSNQSLIKHALNCRHACIEYRSVMSSNFLFLHFSIFMTIFQQNMMKNPHTPNLTWIGSWGPKIWPHEYLISPTEISVNWPGSKQLWKRPIYTDFNGANEVFMRPYLGPPWTDPHQIWTVDVFHHAPSIHGIQNAEMQKKVFCDVITSVLYRYSFTTC